ncbi:MAG: serine--tRNA ligase [Planctomycetes bacterium]|jgi:seryl-tRNA synthetase|nr:serine--tRNA ligase [Planctomycetota bacterium]
MLDLKWLRDNPDAARQGALKKRLPDRAAAVDRALQLDVELRGMTPKLDAMRSELKNAGKELGKLGPAEREAFLAKQKEKKVDMQALEEREKQLKVELDQQLALIPNVPDADVPDGKDDTENVEVRRWGTVREFGFAPRAHYDLGEAQGWLDFERASKMAGSRNYFLFGDLALLHDAVLRYAVDLLVARGFTPVDPPHLVRDAAMFGTGFFPGGEEQTYRAEKDGLNLIGTSEVPVTSLHAGEMLAEADLPKKYVARSVCFRREAGTYGKDTRGLYRVHQFQKVEQVIVDVADKARSIEHHHAIVKNAEDMLQAFELPYRVVAVCGGDLGVPQAMKYDIETWMPSRGNYGETHSASRFYDYQARRLDLRYRPKDGGKVMVCHTLNNTVAASPRLLIPLLENHQQQDGTVRVPAALQPYLGGRSSLGRPIW